MSNPVTVDRDKLIDMLDSWTDEYPCRRSMPCYEPRDHNGLWVCAWDGYAMAVCGQRLIDAIKEATE